MSAVDVAKIWTLNYRWTERAADVSAGAITLVGPVIVLDVGVSRCRTPSLPRSVIEPDSTVIARTKGQLLRRNIKLCVAPWLQRLGLVHLLQTKLRTAATDLSLSSHDLQRSVNSQA
jgi:hypothetical protein